MTYPLKNLLKLKVYRETREIRGTKGKTAILLLKVSTILTGKKESRVTQALVFSTNG